MSDRYFTKFPIVQHGNSACINMLAKIAFNKVVGDKYMTYHPYTLEEGERADTIANWYYGEPSYDWVVYFSNDIVDPYYDWYMESSAFRDFIEEKYGSVVRAQQLIKNFRTNHVEDFSYISVSAYNALSESLKKYWAPVYSINNTVIKYERKKEDVIFETNKTVRLSISLNSNTSFVSGEMAYQQNSGLTVASGIVCFSNTSTAILNKIQGNFSNTYSLTGYDTTASANVSTVEVISTDIPSIEQAYFSPVTYYDYENELNEKKKNINLLDKAYLESITSQFEQLLSQ